VNDADNKPGSASESTSRKHIADLQAVLKVSRDLAIVSDLAPLLRQVQQAALDVLECERATIFLYDAQRHELYSRIAADASEIRFSAERGIAGEAFRTGNVIHVPDAYADPRFNPDIDRATGFRTRNMIAFPLVGLNNKTVGVLQVLNKAAGSFDPWDDELVRTFGAQVGTAVQRQLLLEHYADKQRLQRDLSIAREIQQSLIPKKAAAIEGFDIAGWNKPADETGGDCFDYLTLPDGSLALIIADATGHGIGPALIMAECRALFRATISLSHDLCQIVGRVNSLLCADLPDDRFVTAVFGLLNPRDGTLSYLSAGHGPIIHYTRATDAFVDRGADATPLGISADLPFDESVQLTMHAGDMVVLVTDGFIECCNPAREQFGVDRIHQHVRERRDRPCAEIIRTLYEEVQAFAAGAPQADDLTAIILRKQ
jgi:sigma-B regulation protein RsbU (phosphoserine phosphatase)